MEKDTSTASFNLSAKDIVRMTNVAFGYLAPYFDEAKDFVPDGSTIIFLEPRTRAVAYFVPGGPLPYGYVWERDEHKFATEAEMLAQFIVDSDVL